MAVYSFDNLQKNYRSLKNVKLKKLIFKIYKKKKSKLNRFCSTISVLILKLSFYTSNIVKVAPYTTRICIKRK